MAKYHGLIGFGTTHDIGIDEWRDDIVEKAYYGNITRHYRRNDSRDSLNDDLVLNMQLSIVADPYAMENFQSIRYITYKGARWRVTDIEVAYPRLILEIGSVYNG